MNTRVVWGEKRNERLLPSLSLVRYAQVVRAIHVYMGWPDSRLQGQSVSGHLFVVS